jgi:glutamyl-tRNA synthetase
MGLGNFLILGERLRLVSMSLEEARREKLPIIQWVPLRGALKMRVYEPKELDLIVHEGYVEESIRNYGPDSRLQLIRFGFVRIDRALEDTYIAIFTHQ